jgi:hypothetical protein
MTIEELNEGDVRFHIPPGEPLLTPERLNKKDITFFESDRGGLGIQATKAALMKWLLVNDVIDHKEVLAGQRYQRWRSHSVKAWTGQLLEYEPIEVRVETEQLDGFAEVAFTTICGQLTGDELYLINTAADKYADDADWLRLVKRNDSDIQAIR